MAQRDDHGKFIKGPVVAEATNVVVAKDTFTTGFRTVKRGQLVPSDDPIVAAKPAMFRPYSK
jgi:hypothetical protein